MKTFLFAISLLTCIAIVVAIGTLYFITGNFDKINWLLPLLLIGAPIYFYDRIYRQGKTFSIDRVEGHKTRKFLILSFRALLVAMIVAIVIYSFAQSVSHLFALLFSFLFVEAYFAYTIYIAKKA